MRTCTPRRRLIYEIFRSSNAKVKYVSERLEGLSSSLKGLGALFYGRSTEPIFEESELFGLGQILQNYSEQISRVEDILRSGHDSLTKEEIESSYEAK